MNEFQITMVSCWFHFYVKRSNGGFVFLPRYRTGFTVKFL